MILAIETSQPSLKRLADILTAAGYQVRSAATGARALELLRDRAPELILLALPIPGEDGPALCRQLKTLEPTRNIPLILLTPAGDMEARETCLLLGVDDYVTIPFQSEVLLARVSNQLAQRRTGPPHGYPEAETRGEPRKVVETLAWLNRLHAMLSATNQLIVRAPDRDALFEGVCRIAVAQGGFRFAWIGLTEPDGSIRPVARAGVDGGYIDAVRASGDPASRRGAGPSGQALRSGTHAVSNDFLNDPGTEPWRERAAGAGIAAVAAFPLIQGDRVVGTMNLYAGERGFFNDRELPTLDQMALNVSFGLDNLARDAERQATEQRAREWYARLEGYLAASPSVSYALDAAGGGVRPVWVSENITRLFGYTSAEALREHWWAEHVHPDDLPRARRATDALGSSSAVRHEYRFRKKDGGEVWVLDDMRFLPGVDGGPAQVVGVWTDVTERKLADLGRSAAEESLKLQSAALNAAANAILITDRDGTIVWVNEAFTALSGYTASEALGKNPRELVRSGTHDREFYREMWDTILAGSVWHGELTNRRKDGSLYPEEETITPVKGAEGTISHFIAIKRDLTREKLLQDQFFQSQKMEVVGRLTGGIAHDFNNILMAIFGYADLLVNGLQTSPGLADDAREIRKAADRAATLTRQLLAFSRKQLLVPKLLNLNTVIADLTKLLRRLLGEDIALRLALAPDLGIVSADPGQIEQVIMNLVVNARDAMPAGGPLEIGTANVELDATYAGSHPYVPPGRYVAVRVTDHGTGIAAEDLPHLFEPFFTTKGPGKGTGLGLATVFGIVKQSGGHVQVYSEVGFGSTFKVYLPRTDAVVAPPAWEQPAAAAEGGDETVLIVDDDTVIGTLVERILGERGYTVLRAAGAGAAAEIARRHAGPIHLLLTDVVMPERSGGELAAELGAPRPEMRVLYMSGFTGDAIAHHGLVGAGPPILTKPVDAATLLRVVRAVLDGSR